MSFITDVSDELKALIVATVDGATADNVFSSIKAAQMNVPEKLRKATISLPMWILDAADANPDTEWGCDNSSYRMPVRVIEIRKRDETDAQETIISDLRLIDAEILLPTHTHFLAMENGSIDASPSDETMQAVLDLGVDVYAGTLSYEPGLLCGEWE